MSNQATSLRDYELSPVKFSRLTRRGVLLGLSGSQLVVIGIGAITLVFALYFGGGMSLVYVVPLLLLCAALAWVGVGGRKLVEWLPIVGHWTWRAVGGQLLFRRRIVKPRPAGTLSLPGDAARLRQWLDPESGAVMVHDPHQATLTAIVGVTHPAFILLDPIEQQRRVTSWGRVLATACRSGRIASVQVMERTLPDSGKGLAEWWSQHGSQNGSWTSTTYGELIDRAGPAGERHASTVSIARHEGSGAGDPCGWWWQPRCRRRPAAGDVDDDGSATGRRPHTFRMVGTRRPRSHPSIGLRPQGRWSVGAARRARTRSRDRRPGCRE